MPANPSRLYQQLQNTGVQNKDTPMYQLLRSMIDAVLADFQATEKITATISPVIPPDVSGEDFLTHQNNVPLLPNSRRLLAGTNVTFDDSISNERTVNAAGSSASPSTSSYLTKNNEVLNLPNSIQVLAGAGISFDDSVSNKRTISAVAASTAGAHAFRNADLTVTNLVVTVIPFTHELIDDDDYWIITNPTRFTIPDTGWYAINAQVELAATTSLQLEVSIRKNGTTIIAIQDNFISSITAAGQVTSLVYLTAGDYIELLVYVVSGAATQEVIGDTYKTYMQISNLIAGAGAGGGTYYDWDVLTNGDPINPEVIFADGEVVMIRVP